MSLETLIPYVVNHNGVIIQVLTALILFFVGILAVRGFRASGEPSANASTAVPGLENLEETLKKLLDRAQAIPAAAASGDQAQLVAEISTLRASLQEKQDLIEQLKLAPVETSSEGEASVAVASGLSSEEKANLDAQIRDLQAKLSEYEIISEDIADLSFYKEENNKLQKEIDSLKKGGGASEAPVAKAPAPAAGSAPAPVNTAAAAPASEKPAQAAEVSVPPVATAPAVEAVAAQASPVEPAAVAVNEFVSEQDMVDALIATPVEELAATAKAPAVEISTSSQSSAESSDDEDLMKEFAEAVSAQGGTELPQDEAVAGMLLDVERMTQEANVLEKVAESAADISPEDNLNASLDADRLTAEAADMEKIKPEDAKLMGDFESFMKKGGNS